MGEIWAVIKSIPALIALLQEVLKFAKAVFGDDPKKFIKDSGEVFAELIVAKTPEAKASVAKKIQDLVSRL
jgi:hypothetical protein